MSTTDSDNKPKARGAGPGPTAALRTLAPWEAPTPKVMANRIHRASSHDALVRRVEDIGARLAPSSGKPSAADRLKALTARVRAKSSPPLLCAGACLVVPGVDSPQAASAGGPALVVWPLVGAWRILAGSGFISCLSAWMPAQPDASRPEFKSCTPSSIEPSGARAPPKPCACASPWTCFAHVRCAGAKNALACIMQSISKFPLQRFSLTQVMRKISAVFWNNLEATNVSM